MSRFDDFLPRGGAVSHRPHFFESQIAPVLATIRTLRQKRAKSCRNTHHCIIFLVAGFTPANRTPSPGPIAAHFFPLEGGLASCNRPSACSCHVPRGPIAPRAPASRLTEKRVKTSRNNASRWLDVGRRSRPILERGKRSREDF